MLRTATTPPLLEINWLDIAFAKWFCRYIRCSASGRLQLLKHGISTTLSPAKVMAEIVTARIPILRPPSGWTSRVRHVCIAVYTSGNS